MECLYVDFQENVPRYACTSCFKCTSLFGQSLCNIKKRGCCFYFPKFNLLNIQRMSKSRDGLSVLNKILSNNDTKIYHYYIHSKGYFEEKSYLNFMKNKQPTVTEKSIILQSEKCNIKDLTQFFRVCPFVDESVGCTIPSKYRTAVCNFFICNEVKDCLSNASLLNMYNSSCKDYSRWEDWVNDSLIFLLENNNLNLINNLNDCLKLLRETNLDEYEFPKLPNVSYESKKNYSFMATI